jgi:hypothetical protein
MRTEDFGLSPSISKDISHVNTVYLKNSSLKFEITNPSHSKESPIISFYNPYRSPYGLSPVMK